jgi:type IV pilus assembly protein PilM
MLSLLRKMAGAGPAPLGIDCGSRLLKAVQLRSGEDGYELVAAAAAPVPGAAWEGAGALVRYFRQDVRRLLSSSGFRGRQAVLALPAHHMHATSVREGHAGGAAQDPWAQPTSEWLPFDASEALVRRIEAGDVYDAAGRRREVVTLAVRRPVVERYVEAATAAGLEVVGVTAEPEALLAALALSGADSRLMRLVVDLGLSCTRVYAGIGRRLLFARRLRTGGRDLEAAVTAAVGVGPEEACSLRTRLPPLGAGGDDAFPDERLRKVDGACQETVFRLVTEIRMCLEYVSAVFGNTPVHHVVFVGGGAKYRRLCQRVASGLGLPARAADPLARLAPQPLAGGTTAASGPVWATAVGLAVQGAGTLRTGAGVKTADFDEGAIARLTLAV